MYTKCTACGRPLVGHDHRSVGRCSPCFAAYISVEESIEGARDHVKIISTYIPEARHVLKDINDRLDTIRYLIDSGTYTPKSTV